MLSWTFVRILQDLCALIDQYCAIDTSVAETKHAHIVYAHLDTSRKWYSQMNIIFPNPSMSG